MNIQQFNYVLAVAEYRHFETAAESCFVAQSTLSTMISRFEEEIDIMIFDRSVKPVEITQEGEFIVSRLKRIRFEIDQLQDGIQALKGEMKGEIKIGCIPTVAPFLLPLFLQHFSVKYPDLFLEVRELTTSEIQKQLMSRDLDIGIVSTSIFLDDLNKMPLYEESFVLYDASDTIEKQIRIQDINMDRFWLLEEGHCMRTQVLEICDTPKPQLNPSFNINYKVGSIDSLLRFVKANKGKTLLPILAVKEFTEEEQLHLSYFKGDIPFREIGLVTHQHFVKSKVLELLQKEIVSVVQNIEGIKIITDKIKQTK